VFEISRCTLTLGVLAAMPATSGCLRVDGGLSRCNIRDLAASLKTPQFSASNRRCSHLARKSRLDLPFDAASRELRFGGCSNMAEGETPLVRAEPSQPGAPAATPAASSATSWFDKLLRVSTLIGGFAVVFTLAGSAIAFYYQRNAELTTRLLEEKKTLLDKQAEIYFAAVPLMSKIANHYIQPGATPTDPKSNEIQDSSMSFWNMYWGELNVATDDNTAKVLNLFSTSLAASQSATFQGEHPKWQTCSKKILELSKLFSICAKESILVNWGVSLSTDNIKCTDAQINEITPFCSI